MSEHRTDIRPEEQEKTAWPLILILSLVAIIFRSFPETNWFNFTPIAAIALFAGARIRSRLAFLIPLLVMISSDIILWLTKSWTPFNLSVYLSFGLIILLGNCLRRTESVWKIGTACLLGSVLFFLITNFAVWTTSTVPMSDIPAGQSMLEVQSDKYDGTEIRYAGTFSGLITCYVMALPFFKFTLFGDLFYTALIFGAQALLWRRYLRQRLRPAPVHSESSRSQQ